MSECTNCQEGKAASGSKGSASSSAAAKKAQIYQALLNHWWPASAPLPPAMPWLGLRVSRAQVVAGIGQYLDRLPELPSADPTSATNMEVLMEFARREMEAESGSAKMLMSGGCTGCECQSCEAAAVWQNVCGSYDIYQVVEDPATYSCTVTCIDPNTEFTVDQHLLGQPDPNDKSKVCY